MRPGTSFVCPYEYPQDLLFQSFNWAVLLTRDIGSITWEVMIQRFTMRSEA